MRFILEVILILLLLASFVSIFVGLIAPQLYKPLFRKDLGRGKTALIFIGICIATFIIVGIFGDNLTGSSSVNPSENKAVVNNSPTPQPVRTTPTPPKITKKIVMIGNTNLADWQALKGIDDKIIKDKNITMASCKTGDVSDTNASSYQKAFQEYQYNTSMDMLDAQNQRQKILNKLGYNQVTPTQALEQTLLSDWQKLKSLDDQAFDTYVDEYGLCVAVQGDLSYGDLESAKQDEQAVNSDSDKLENMNLQRANLLKRLGYSGSVLMGGVYY